VSTILHEKAARGTAIDLTTLPKCSPVGRTPWCTEDDGHPNDWHTADQECRSEIHQVTLRAWDQVEVHECGDEMPSRLGGALAANIDDPMHVGVVLNEVAGQRAGFSMTCEEAKDLAFDLLLPAAQPKGTM
jgi:hypothetical protein